MFPPFTPLHNKTEFDLFLNSLKHLRQKSFERPVTFPSVLPFLRACRNPTPPPGSAPLPETCRIPSIFRPETRQRLLPKSPLTEMPLILTESIQTGANHLSQTYRGHVNLPGCKPANVVVKLFQQSLFRYPCPAHFFDRLSRGNWRSATYLAQREAWAYDKMTMLQGTTIPHSYGFYMVSMHITLKFLYNPLHSSSSQVEKKLSVMSWKRSED